MPVQNKKLNRPDFIPVKIDAWIKELPLANIGETARSIYLAILDLKTVDLTLVNRFKILESLRATARYLTKSLRKYYINQTLPLTDKGLAVANLTNCIHFELATQYASLVDQKEEKILAPLEKEQIITVIHRSLFHYSRVLLTAYQVYNRPPKGTWLGVHTMYSYAKNHDLLEGTLRDSNEGNYSSLTIENQYKLILLLSVLNPNQYSYKKIMELVSALVQISALTTIRVLNYESEPTSCGFIIPMSEDNPPQKIDPQINSHTPSDFFDVSKLLENLIEAELNLENLSIKDIEPNLVSSIHANITQFTVRKSVRERASSTAPITIGLTSTHKVICRAYNIPTSSNADDGSVGVSEHAMFTSKPFHQTDEHSPDVWNPIYATEYYMNISGEVSLTSEVEINHSAVDCQIANEGQGGYCFRWKMKDAGRLRIGELIGIGQNEQINDTWHLGIIKWLRQAEKNDIVFGVELIAAHIEPVSVTLQKNEKPSALHQGFLIYAGNHNPQPTSIILPSYLFQQGEKVSVNSKSRMISAQLAEPLNETQGFNQFNLLVEKASHSANDNGSETAQAASFENLWKTL